MKQPVTSLFWALLIVASLHTKLASPAPYRPEQKYTPRSVKKRQNATPLIVQANSWANDHAPALAGPGAPSTFTLPPVSDVFKILADPNLPHPPVNPQNQPPTPPPSPGPPANDHNPAPAPPSPGQISHPPEHDHHSSAPGHVPAPARRPGSENIAESTDKSGENGDGNVTLENGLDESSTPEGDRRKNLAPVGKLILIALVMAGIITLIFCIYFLVDRRALACCCRKRKSRRNKPYILDDSADEQEPKGSPVISYPKFFPVTPEQQHYGYEIENPMPPVVHPLHGHNDTNVVPGLPPSRIPITAKPYPFSARGSSQSSNNIPAAPAPLPSSPLSQPPCSPLPPPPPTPIFPSTTPIHDLRRARRSSTPAPLLPPSEFFCMPSPSETTINLHSRLSSRPRSNPIFGHIVARCMPEIKKLRSGEHRKSKSVSGLVYIVDTKKVKTSGTADEEYANAGWARAYGANINQNGVAPRPGAF